MVVVTYVLFVSMNFKIYVLPLNDGFAYILFFVILIIY